MLALDLLPQRLTDKIDVTDDCWLWLGWTVPPYGYPRFRWEGRDMPAYRVTYELLIGPISDGLELDHLCNVARCVNPAHLEPVTHAENMRRIQDRQQSCRSKGHDWTDPYNVYRRLNGRRFCAECERQRQRDRRSK